MTRACDLLVAIIIIVAIAIVINMMQGVWYVVLGCNKGKLHDKQGRDGLG